MRARVPTSRTREPSVVRDSLAWLRRARRLIPEADRRVLLSPPRLVARFTRYALLHGRGRDAHAVADDVGERDPELIALFDELAHGLARLFRLRVEDVDNVPARGPVLLVGNHNGGLLPTDGFFTAMAVREHFGSGRAVYGLAHDFLFEDPVLRRYALALGILRANDESARHAFGQGQCVMVYPGSDLDTYRRFNQRGKVVLGGRKGFLRLALREQVPIVPVVSAGTHEQFIVLARGDRLARLLGAHRWARTDVFPIVLSLPWGVTSGFVPYLPLPAQTTIAFGTPMTWPDLEPADADRPEALARCYAEVEARMQGMLTHLQAGRRFLLGGHR
jgi:1-acyl-sn-glycerol-3-phosphate acyltransferase